jgi:hypothetical protein
MKDRQMANEFNKMPDQQTWSILVSAAKRALEAQGFTLTRVPGRGRSNVWQIERHGKIQRASIRTTKDRWFAFPPLKRGTKWKTLDDVDVVIVAAVDDREDPRNVEVYLFDAAEVRRRFDANYAARTKAGLIVQDNFGMWVNLDKDNRQLPASVGAGLAAEHKPIAEFSLHDLLAEGAADAELAPGDAEVSEPESDSLPRTIADVMDWARQRIATLSGVRMDAVKLDLKIEY